MSDHVKSLSIVAGATRAQESRAVKAKSYLKSTRDMIEVMTSQADAISTERDNLRDEVKRLQEKVDRRTAQLRASRKGLRKEKKKLERSEEHFFMSTYDMIVRKLVEAGLDHKLVLIDGLGDLVDKEVALNAPLVVSSDPDEDMSD